MPDTDQPITVGQDPRPVCVIVPGRARPDQVAQVKTALKCGRVSL